MVHPAAGHPVLWIPAGDWAEWAGSLLAGASILTLAIGRRRDRCRARIEHRSEQARHVSAWIDAVERVGAPPSPQSDPHAVVRMTVSNAGLLAVRDVIGYLIHDDELLATMPAIHLAPPGTRSVELAVSDCPARLLLVVAFDDDAGVRWRKYGPGRPVLEESGPGQIDVAGLVKHLRPPAFP